MGQIKNIKLHIVTDIKRSNQITHIFIDNNEVTNKIHNGPTSRSEKEPTEENGNHVPTQPVRQNNETSSSEGNGSKFEEKGRKVNGTEHEKLSSMWLMIFVDGCC